MTTTTTSAAAAPNAPRAQLAHLLHAAALAFAAASRTRDAIDDDRPRTHTSPDTAVGPDWQALLAAVALVDSLRAEAAASVVRPVRDDAGSYSAAVAARDALAQEVDALSQKLRATEALLDDVQRMVGTLAAVDPWKTEEA
ncbi:hypothetical protein HDU83_000346 [Entophlyctis luteolus]|nr:hypothetical protein HDU83_000346 [Entophlyctis luteolus]